MAYRHTALAFILAFLTLGPSTSQAGAAAPRLIYVHYSGTISVSHPSGMGGGSNGVMTSWGTSEIKLSWNGTGTVDIAGSSSVPLHFSQFTGSIHYDGDGAPAGTKTAAPCTAQISELAGAEQKLKPISWDITSLTGPTDYSVSLLYFTPVLLSDFAQSSAPWPASLLCGLNPEQGLGSSWTYPSDPFCPEQPSAAVVANYDKVIAPKIIVAPGGSKSESFNLDYTVPCQGRPLTVELKSVLSASFTSKSTPPAQGNPKPTTGRPKPKSGIEIVNLANGKPVTEQTISSVVGQPSAFRVRTKDGTQPRDPKWTVPGSGPRGEAVKGYVITETSGRVDPLLLSDENDDVVRFHFVKAGQHEVAVTASGDREWVKVDVVAPTVGPDPAKMCETGIASTSHNPRLPGTILGVGYTDNCATTAGIRWNFNVRAPEDGAGNIAMVQLLTKEVKHSSITVNAVVEPLHVCPKLTRPTPWADDASFYDQLHKSPAIWEPPIASGGTASWVDSDSPHLPLRTAPIYNSNTWYEKFDAVDYLMYKSEADGSVWVPLATLTWGWSGLAHFLLPPAGKNKWLLQGSSTAVPAFDDSPPQLPEWPAAFVGSDHADCSS